MRLLLLLLHSAALLFSQIQQLTSEIDVKESTFLDTQEEKQSDFFQTFKLDILLGLILLSAISKSEKFHLFNNKNKLKFKKFKI